MNEGSVVAGVGTAADAGVQARAAVDGSAESGPSAGLTGSAEAGVNRDAEAGADRDAEAGPGPGVGRRTFARRFFLTADQVFIQYYKENDVLFSPEGILKLISIAGCAVLAALSLAAPGACAGALAAPAGAAAALGVAAAQALLLAARALHLPLRAAHAHLLTDIIVCSAGGALLAVWGTLRVLLCRAAWPAGVLALAAGAVCVGGATCTYCAAMRVWDHSAPPRAPPTAPRRDHDA